MNLFIFAKFKTYCIWPSFCRSLYYPFEDKSFELVLSGHFLFTYSHKLDFSLILSSILELYRVSSREVRIYPLQKSSLQPYEQMTELLFALERLRIRYDIVSVPFEFQRGSNKMLLLRRAILTR
jgi:hypothetical protein